jgi:sec-independent protein translocase protein TatA
MFGIGGGELIFIVIIALMLFGTKGIPDAARTFAKVMAQVKNASNDIKSEIQKSVDDHEIRSSVKQITSNFTDEVDSIKNSVNQSANVTPANPVSGETIDTPNPVVKPTEEEDIETLSGPIKRRK